MISTEFKTKVVCPFRKPLKVGRPLLLFLALMLNYGTPGNAFAGPVEGGAAVNFDSNPVYNFAFFGTAPDGGSSGPTILPPPPASPSQPANGLQIQNLTFTQTAAATISFSFERNFTLTAPSPLFLGVNGFATITITPTIGSSVKEIITEDILAQSGDGFVTVASVSTSVFASTSTKLSWNASGGVPTLQAGSYIARYTRQTIWTPGQGGATLRDPDSFDGGTVAVPEPASIVLFGVGALCLPVYRWRRRQQIGR